MKKNITIITVCILILLTGCSKDDASPTSLSSEKEITAFKFLAIDNEGFENDINGNIDQKAKTIAFTLPSDSDVSSLMPNITVSAKAVVSPEGTQNFTNPLNYTVTAEDGTKSQYTVTVAFELSSEKEIISFKFLKTDNPLLDADIEASINAEDKTIETTFPGNPLLNSLIPQIEISPKASIDPMGSKDFTDMVFYTVTAEDESEVQYKVSVTSEAAIQRNALIAIYNANPNNTLGWDLSNPNPFYWNGVMVDIHENILSLDLDSKNIDVIPPQIKDLKYLISLSAHQNNLTTLPAEIGLLENLKDLFIGNNQLNSIPAEIGDLKNLQRLYIAFNNLETFPVEISGLSGSLGFLVANNNNIHTLPESLWELNTLVSLNLSFNNLESLSPGIKNSPQLTILNLHHNNLDEIPDEIGEIFTLEELAISQNNLTSIPSKLGDLSNLKKLYIDENNITNLPFQLGNLSKLQILDFTDTNVTQIPQSVCNLFYFYGTNLYYDSGLVCNPPPN